MAGRWAPCSRPGCGKLHQGTGRCPTCRTEAERARRPQGNPYRGPGHHAFREAVLARNPRCVCTDGSHDHGPTMCGQVATVADHYPTERVDLIAQGLDPNDPARGRGLCKRCHDKHTAATKPSGWRDQG